MSSLKKELPWHAASAPHPVSEAARRLAAGLLWVASAALARLAATLAIAPSAVAQDSRDPRFEFHAEAGAPEGALYVDGELVGRLPGVQRL
jgi:hypothetical protein